MLRKIEVEHFSVTSSKPFEKVLAAISGAVGHPDMAEFWKSTHTAESVAELERAVKPALGRTGLMQFVAFDHSAIIRKGTGRDAPRNVRLLVGKPLIMKEMVKYVPDAGSYAPVTVLVDERADGVHLSYDRMASFLAAYGNRDALRVAEDLDNKIETLLREAAGLSVRLEVTLEKEAVATQEDPMNADVLTTRVADGIAVIRLGSTSRIYFDEEMGDALTEALDGFAGDASVRVVVVTGGAPGYFIRHYSIAALVRLAESLRASGREWPENATYNGGFLDKAIALCESMPKPVIAAISGTALAGGFEFALSCDLRIAEDGDYLIGFLEPHLGLVPGAGGTQRLPRTIGTPAALMHILMGDPLTPREAERKGLVHETVNGKALDRAMEIARRLSSFTPESVAYIKRLVRNATETPLAQGLALERNLFLKLCVSESALARMRSYEGKKITSPSRGFEA